MSLALLLLALIAPSRAAEHMVVRTGDTVESLARGLGDERLAAELRSLNGLGPSEQPPVGAVLRVPAAAATRDDQPALVLSLTGTGTVRFPEGAERALAPQLWLPVGTSVCTEIESFASIRLATATEGFEHDDVTLLPNTCLTVVSAAARPGRRSSLLNVTEGAIAVRGGMAEPGTVTVQTPDGVATGDQGGFRVTLERGATRAEAVSAPVSVMGNGAEVALVEKQATRVREGEAPGKPADLLTGPALYLPEDGAPLRWPDFQWQPVQRSLGYRVQISTSPDFSEVVHQVEVPYPAWRPDYLLLPYRVPGYWWRVSPLDRFGFEGVPSTPRLLAVPTGVGP